MKLFLKGQRCFSPSCAVDKRNFVPGEHGRDMRTRSKSIGYGLQLREKQKVKRIYGVLERQFRRYFQKAAKRKCITGELLLQFLELRLDNVVHRLGFATSRSQARQFVRHGHLTVNGRKVNIPSYQVKKGDEVAIRQKSTKNPFILSSVDEVAGRGVPSWLSLDKEGLKGQIVELPRRDEIGIQIEESLVVELYSK
jgi:small subunit ribosomal protein S4